jgi:hypothetical protein
MANKVPKPSRERRRLGIGRVPALRAARDPGLLVDRSRAATAKRIKFEHASRGVKWFAP